MASKEITFYAHPSNYGNEYFPQIEPYDRIAGLTIDDETLWTKASILPDENSYQRVDTVPLTVSLPEPLATATADYFRDFYADPARFYRISDPLSEYVSHSNCHRFGMSVWSGRPQTFLDAISMASSIVGERQNLIHSAALPLGQLAIIGTTTHKENALEVNSSFASHTMLSIEKNRYLQVAVFAGNMGISRSVEKTLTFYQESEHPSLDIYHSRHIPPPAPDPKFVDDLRRALS